MTGQAWSWAPGDSSDPPISISSVSREGLTLEGFAPSMWNVRSVGPLLAAGRRGSQMKAGVVQGGFCMELAQENWEVGRADYKRSNSLTAEEELLRGAGTQWGMKEQ